MLEHGKCEKCGLRVGTVEINGVYDWCVAQSGIALDVIETTRLTRHSKV